MVSKSQQKASRKYNEKNYGRLYIFVDKDIKQSIRQIAADENISINQYITDLITKDMLQRGRQQTDAGSFQAFRDNLHIQLKTLGDTEFIVRYLQNGQIQSYWDNNERLRALYLLSMIDYLCRTNHLPLCGDYETLRKYTFDEPVFIGDTKLTVTYDNYEDKVRHYREKAIPEFARHNILEGDLYDVV